ncbi:MAG: hypothetical protein KA715_02410 [Xanthomonadaceae bacterium]|nr:hypothetical protein [Xanthomonadaceae bacterium]
MESAERVVGCGGHYVRDDKKLIGIAWVMFERNSIGVRAFLKAADSFFEAILSRIRLEPVRYSILINTTQLMEKLFTRYGFRTQERIKDGFGQNLDHLVMIRSDSEP